MESAAWIGIMQLFPFASLKQLIYGIIISTIDILFWSRFKIVFVCRYHVYSVMYSLIIFFYSFIHPSGNMFSTDYTLCRLPFLTLITIVKGIYAVLTLFCYAGNPTQLLSVWWSLWKRKNTVMNAQVYSLEFIEYSSYFL